ncbi:MAG: Gfo/Idh/MocA family protein [Thermoguttaceae bacterium]
MKTSKSRRRFLRDTVGLTATGILSAYCVSSDQPVRAESKNDRPSIGCIGVGGQGLGDSMSAARFGEVVAVCDVDLNHAEQAKAKFGETVQVYQDYRRLLDRKDIEVIIQGAPDHWHTKINVDACLAGKDVYGEKPLTLTIDEGKILCKVVKETGRVLQTGTQQRSDKSFQTAVELVRNGRLGPLKQVWVALPYFSTKGGPFGPEDVPNELDWDMYEGQSPVHPYTHNRCHSIFRWWYEYGGGIVTDWGNHHVDIAHWGMDCELTGPGSIEARGLFPNEGRADCYNTPDRFFSRMIYPNGVELLYFSSMNDKAIYGEVEQHAETAQDRLDWLFGRDVPEEIKTFDRNGIMFIGEKGRIFVNRGGLYGKAVEELKESPLSRRKDWKVRPSSDQMQNFFDCVKSREVPVSPVDIQHRSISACHLTNISIRLGGRKLTWDAELEQFSGDDEANAMLKREQRQPYTITS